MANIKRGFFARFLNWCVNYTRAKNAAYIHKDTILKISGK